LCEEFRKKTLTRAFAYLSRKNIPQVGVDWEGTTYNFTQAWEIFKQIKLNGKAPELGFLQIMVELDLFHTETFDEVLNTLREFRPLNDLVLSPPFAYQVPIERPQKIICIGRNYREHAKELGNAAPGEPVFFGKAPSSLLAHEQAVRLPSGFGAIHYEIELGVLIGKTASNIAAESALEFIAGYTILNDVTARELQKKDIAAGLPWFRAKSFDTFCPIGPCLVPRESIADPQNLGIELRVNGKIRQKASTADMIFPVSELVSHVSRFCTLYPGDIIATGTPAGVGPLQSGDMMEGEIEGLGVLRNPVR
jgi:2-keto-4-pentenoate hydratase/2-oxohepta-3-ene-1,7-dioic acid hydratase in catechol pathway